MSKKEELIKEAKNLEIEINSKDTIKSIQEKIITSKSSNLKENDFKEDRSFAKSGKRSLKVHKEKEDLLKKEQQKNIPQDKVSKTKSKIRPKIERRSKNYKNSFSKIDKSKNYEIQEAITILKTTSSLKFDQTVEVHIRLNVDPRHADQNIRDMVILPFGTGKKVRVAVYSEDTIKDLSADIVGGTELLESIERGIIDFDILITTPNLMPKLAKYARLLGPKGLMPNPKSGTVSNDLLKAVSEAKAGKIEYRVDSNGIIHSGVGKLSFGADQLLKNAESLINSVKNNKPNSIKGNFIKSIFVTTTMGPSISLTIN